MAANKDQSKQATEPVADEATDVATDVATEPASTGQPDDVEHLGYEQARDELIAIVAQLEGGALGLEESMRLWERGEALAQHCSTWLDAATTRLGSKAGKASEPTVSRS